MNNYFNKKNNYYEKNKENIQNSFKEIFTNLSEKMRKENAIERYKIKVMEENIKIKKKERDEIKKEKIELLGSDYYPSNDEDDNYSYLSEEEKNYMKISILNRK